MIDAKKAAMFLARLYKGDGTFGYSPVSRLANLYSTCFGVLATDLINRLEEYSTEEKDKIASFIKRHQNRTTGLFEDIIAEEAGGVFTNEYAHLQLTDFSQMALAALGATPDQRYVFLEKYKKADTLAEWLRTLETDEPWLASNRLMFIFNSLIFEKVWHRADNDRHIEHILSWLREREDAATGYWRVGANTSLFNRMAAAFHFFIFYTYCGVKPCFAEKMITTTLSLQNYDGLFSFAGGGGSCEDLDAIDILCRATLYTDRQNERIKKRLRKSYDALVRNQNEDGGFCWARREDFDLRRCLCAVSPRLFAVAPRDAADYFLQKIHATYASLFHKESFTWCYSGIPTTKISMKDSDIWSTWFRLLAISLIESTFPEIVGGVRTFDWKMKKTSGLGFYR